MGSFFKNLLKSGNTNPEAETKKPASKWLFMFKKTNDQSDQNPFVLGQEDNHGRLKNSNMDLSSGSLNSMDNGDTILLPKLRKQIFHVPRYVPPNDWIRSQLFEIAHLISSFVDLISAKNLTLAKHFDSKLEEIIQHIDDQNAELKMIFINLFDLISCIYKDEMHFWMELKFEAHLNSLLAQLIELCSQLPEQAFSEVMDATKTQGHAIDASIYRSAMARFETQSISKTGSDISGDIQ